MNRFSWGFPFSSLFWTKFSLSLLFPPPVSPLQTSAARPLFPVFTCALNKRFDWLLRELQSPQLDLFPLYIYVTIVKTKEKAAHIKITFAEKDGNSLSKSSNMSASVKNDGDHNNKRYNIAHLSKTWYLAKHLLWHQQSGEEGFVAIWLYCDHRLNLTLLLQNCGLLSDHMH